MPTDSTSGAYQPASIDPLERFTEASVLVIDDDQANLTLVSTVLRRGGLAHVHTEADARRIDLDRLHSLAPDLVILDLHMPHVDGYAILQRIAEFSAGSYVPVLVLTGDTGTSTTRRALEAGAHDFVAKPFDSVELLLRVRNLLENRFLRVTLRHSALPDPLRDFGSPNARQLEGIPSVSTLSQAPSRGSLIDRELARHRRERIEYALSHDAITMEFQPVVDTAKPAVVGHEALARFRIDGPPTHGFDNLAGAPQLSTQQWFSDAADVGLGTELELAALRSAFRSAPQLEPGTFLAVNVSPGTVLSDQLESVIPEALCPHLVLELTEHTPVENYEVVLKRLAALRAAGARLAVDDTGAGYAGFRHLVSLHPEIIKLDITLTRGIEQRPSHRALASALVSFATDVNAQLIAEGVETTAEASTLTDLGITWMQGFVFARPAPTLIRDSALGRYSLGR